MKLRRAILFVKSIEPMTAFYRDAIGLTFKPEQSSQGWAVFNELALHQIPAEIAAQIEITSPPAARTDTPIKLVFVVPHMLKARQRLIEAGAVMLEVKSWGCDGLDLEGNVFQIVDEATA